MVKKHNRVWLALVALVLCVATVVYGDYNVQNKGTYYNNASTGLRTNSEGVLLTSENTSNQNYNLLVPEWLNTRLQHRIAGGPPPTVGVFMQDSTLAQDVRGYNGLALMIYPTFDDSASAVVLALQVRWHYTDVVDSQTTFIEMATRTYTAAHASGYPTVTAGPRDSIGSLLWSDAATPYQVNKYGEEADSLATPDEQVLVLTNSVGQNRGRLIRITPPNAPPGYSAGPYMSIRLRHLNTAHVTGAWLGEGAAPAKEVITNIKVSLVGWR